MTTPHPHRSPGRQGSGIRTVVIVLAGLVVVGGIAAAGVAFGPGLIDSASNDETSTSTGTTLPAGAEGEVLVAVTELARAVEAGDLSTVDFAGERIEAGQSTTSAAGDGLTVDGSDTTPASTATSAVDDFAALMAGVDEVTLLVEPASEVAFDGNGAATVSTEVTWTFPGGAEWVSAGLVSLVRADGDQWLVDWSPSVLEASLGPGDRLRTSRLEPIRAPIVARNGEVLVGNVDLVRVGVQPSRVDDLPSLAAELQRLVGADPAEVTAAVTSAAPDAFVEVVALRQEDYEQVESELFPLPGTVFRSVTEPVNTDPELARALLGRPGEVTAEIIEENPGLFAPGDVVGVSGLQADYNTQLAGSPGLQLEVIRATPDPSSTTTGTGLTTTSAVRRANEAEMLFTSPARDGEALILTIDPRYQRAAEQALAGESKPSAMVVIQASTGQVLAVANGPTGSTVNFAMTGQYPPGSIFKVITGYSLLESGLGELGPVDCPFEVTIGGATFGNAEGESLSGTVPFRAAFAQSCNTAFITASRDVALDELNRAGALFGQGVDYQLGADVFSGDVPVNSDNVDLASASFGQGRTLFSPFSAAVMSATAADGTYRSPVLITSGEPPVQEVVPLEPDAAQTLQSVMRAVVTEGTGGVVGGVPGGPVSGKTGTAEFGSAVPPRTHAWFVGYQGDLAFAVLVEDGGFGGSTAAPLAANFLASVAGLPVDG